MKINKMPSKELVSIKARLETIREKTDSAPAKGDESPSLYYRHITEQLLRREGK
jgi:hypothetical protein